MRRMFYVVVPQGCRDCSKAASLLVVFYEYAFLFEYSREGFEEYLYVERKADVVHVEHVER